MLNLDALKDKLLEMQNEVHEKDFQDLDFDTRLAELRGIMNELGPLVEAFNEILPEEDLTEMNESLKEANSCLDNMATELSKLKQLDEEQDAFFKANRTE